MARLGFKSGLALVLLLALQPALHADVSGLYTRQDTGGLCSVDQIGNNLYLFTGTSGGQATFSWWSRRQGVMVLMRTDGSWPDNVIVTAFQANTGQIVLDLQAPGIGLERWVSVR